MYSLSNAQTESKINTTSKQQQFSENKNTDVVRVITGDFTEKYVLLVLILRYKRTYNRHVVPFFTDVENVRSQNVEDTRFILRGKRSRLTKEMVEGIGDHNVALCACRWLIYLVLFGFVIVFKTHVE